jgi:four helix bundle protein
MAQINGFEDLIGWQKAMDLVESIYRLTVQFPTEERYGLTSQLRRAAVSTPSNVAEGYGRRTRADYVRFVDIARGSANEIQTQLVLCQRLRMATQEQIRHPLEQVKEVQRILKGLVHALELSAKSRV